MDPYARYARLICVVPTIGTGKPNDPIRPEYAPRSAEEAEKSGIVAWSSQLTDDKHSVILHLVAKDKRAFDPILNDKRAQVVVQEVGKHDKNGIQKEMKKYKKDFDLEDLKVVAR